MTKLAVCAHIHHSLHRKKIGPKICWLYVCELEVHRNSITIFFRFENCISLITFRNILHSFILGFNVVESENTNVVFETFFNKVDFLKKNHESSKISFGLTEY